ncbi:hypothetical protein [Oryza sativa Japonica Group]|uniref:Uncharacterized protein B1147A04.1 n=1 Tax=Oryza sativa subsp. japonica TaxID=39947 RepID=Q5JKZ0_ORYSJ|nr:hypothetical protein [Oryza sativa Japonica Group]
MGKWPGALMQLSPCVREETAAGKVGRERAVSGEERSPELRQEDQSNVISKAGNHKIDGLL